MEEYGQERIRGVSASSLNTIPLFDPDLFDARSWLTQVENFARLFHWTDEDKLIAAKCRLGSTAQIWACGSGPELGNWPSFRRAFTDRFAVREDELYSRLANCRQGKKETVRHYADRYRHLCSQLGIDPAEDPT